MVTGDPVAGQLGRPNGVPQARMRVGLATKRRRYTNSAEFQAVYSMNVAIPASR
jgi:hypothetical protein